MAAAPRRLSGRDAGQEDVDAGQEPRAVVVFAQPGGRLLDEWIGVDTYLHDVDRRYPGAARAVGDGARYALVPGEGFLAHREAGNVIHAYVVLSRPAEWFDAGIARARLAAEFEGRAPELLSLITGSDTEPVLRPIYRLPDRHRWDRVPGVTLSPRPRRWPPARPLS